MCVKVVWVFFFSFLHYGINLEHHIQFCIPCSLPNVTLYICKFTEQNGSPEKKKKHRRDKILPKENKNGQEDKDKV
jgi:hypothetical protein